MRGCSFRLLLALLLAFLPATWLRAQESTHVALVFGNSRYVHAGEINDKGYINQRAVLGNRAEELAALEGSDPQAFILPG